jgi:hypothetical protein
MRWAILVLLLAASCPAEDKGGVAYREEVRDRPRPLRIHILSADLSRPDLELAVAVAPDPDGAGPAEARLADPRRLCEAAGLVAAVNSNAFGGFPRPDGQVDRSWHDGQPVDILGLAVATGEEVRSADAPGAVALWSAGDRVWIGPPPPGIAVLAGCAGFGWLLRDGRDVPTADQALHPRTAAGLDRTGTRLWLVVVDGRQPGWSEGLTTDELVPLMRDLGCHDAINLDGGGSSIVILRDRPDRPPVMNRPSTRVFGTSFPRPVPVMVGVRRRL